MICKLNKKKMITNSKNRKIVENNLIVNTHVNLYNTLHWSYSQFRDKLNNEHQSYMNNKVKNSPLYYDLNHNLRLKYLPDTQCVLIGKKILCHNKNITFSCIVNLLKSSELLYLLFPQFSLFWNISVFLNFELSRNFKFLFKNKYKQKYF